MKKSIRLRARAFARVSAPALSVLSLAVAASVQAQGIEVNPVVVSATRMEQPLSEVLSSVSVITRQDIEKSQAPSLADLLQGEAGFEFGRNGGLGAVTSFFLRGQDSTNMVIMVDGVRTQIDSIGALTMTDMPLSQIERIEVLRGNAGALYGESAIGGVIHIFTRKGKGIPAAYGSVSYGSRNTSQINAGYGGESGDYSFDLNLGRTGTDGFSAKMPATGINPDKDGASSEYGAAKIEKKMNGNLTVGVRLLTKSNKTDYDASGLVTDTHQFNTATDTVGVFARQVINELWVSSLDVSGSNFTYEDIKNGALSNTGLYSGHQDNVRWFNSYQLQPKTTVNFGLDTAAEKYSQRATYDMTRDTLGYFVGLNSQVDKLTFQVNLRHDEIHVGNTNAVGAKSNDANASTGLLGLGYQLTPELRLTSTVSTGFRAPTADQVSTSPSLTPERHKSQEAGLVYASGNSVARVVYFQTSTNDAISWNGTWPCTQNCYKNIGQTENKGVEASVRANWMGTSIKVTAVEQDPWNVSANSALARRARHYGSIDLSRPVAGYELGAKVYATGERPDWPNVGGYALWSFYASHKIDNAWTARVKLENAFDRQYQVVAGYNTPGRGIFATLQYQPK